MWLQIAIIAVLVFALFPGIRRWVMRIAGRAVYAVGLLALLVVAVIALSHG